MTASKAACAVHGCKRPPYQSREYCAPHRARHYRYGDPLGKPEPWRRDLAGQRFGRLIAVEYDTTKHAWVCLCDCGAWSRVRAWSLTSGGSRSCGQRRRHLVARSYPQAHEHLRAIRGRAAAHPCARCTRPARHWSYRREHAKHRIESEFGPWSPSPEDYEALCVQCHKRADLTALAIEQAAANGLHPLF